MVDAALRRGPKLGFSPIWFAVPVAVLGILGVTFLTRLVDGGPQAGEYDGNGVSFSYPEHLVPRGLAETPLYGDEHWVVSIGFEDSLSSSVLVYGIDEAALASYSWSDEEMAAVMADLEANWDGGELVQPFTHTHVAGMQAIQYAYMDTIFTGEEVRSIDTIVFDPEAQHMYRIQCQSVAELNTQMDAACQQVLSTFKVD